MATQASDAPSTSSKEQRGEATKRLLLDAALADMEATGEASIRITKVLRESGVTNGSLYYHFGNREGLVQAAIAERFIGSVSVGLGRFAALAGEVDSIGSLSELIRAELVRVGTPEVKAQRVQRFAALAAALPRPQLLEQIVEQQAAYFDRAAAAFRTLQDRGVISSEIEVRAFCAWALGLTLSRLLSDIDPQLEPDDEWSEFTHRAMMAILTP